MAKGCKDIDLTKIHFQLGKDSLIPLLLIAPRFDFAELSHAVDIFCRSRVFETTKNIPWFWSELSEIDQFARNLCSGGLFDGHKHSSKGSGAK